MPEQTNGKIKYLFSVVMPVYNAGSYLNEAAESLISQTVGFEENIQLIFVNDGSTDNSAEVCRKYAQCYPDNIIYYEQENAGASAARNAGIRFAEGRYVNFMDPDDRWSQDAFAVAADFFAAHPGIHIVSAKIFHFGRRTADDPLNYIYDEDKEIDLWLMPEQVQVTVHNLWIERELLCGIAFDENMRFGEDSLFVNQLLMKEMRYGALMTPVYWYRERPEGDSAMDGRNTDPFFYAPILKGYSVRLFEMSRRLYGYVIPYVQQCVMFDLKWRMKIESVSFLPENEAGDFLNVIVSLLSEIDDNVIAFQRRMNREQKISVLALKRGISADELRAGLRIIKGNTYYTDPGSKCVQRLWSANWERMIHIYAVEERADDICIEGFLFSTLLRDRIKVAAEVNGKMYEAQVFEREDLTVGCFWDEKYIRRLAFKAVFPAGCFRLHLYLNGKEEKAFIDDNSVFSVGDSRFSFKVHGDAEDKEFYYFERSSDMSGEEFMDHALELEGAERVSYIMNTYQQYYAHNSINREVNKKENALLKQKREKLKKYKNGIKELAFTEEDLMDLRAQNKELRAQNTVLAGKNDKLSEKISNMSHSFSWKIGSIITWIPNKLKMIFGKA